MSGSYTARDHRNLPDGIRPNTRHRGGQSQHKFSAQNGPKRAAWFWRLPAMAVTALLWLPPVMQEVSSMMGE